MYQFKVLKNEKFKSSAHYGNGTIYNQQCGAS
jgi:hypothetical protein